MFINKINYLICNKTDKTGKTAFPKTPGKSCILPPAGLFLPRRQAVRLHLWRDSALPIGNLEIAFRYAFSPLPVHLCPVVRPAYRHGVVRDHNHTSAGRLLDMPPGGRLALVLPLAGGRGHQLAPPTHPAWRWGLLDVIAPSHSGEHTSGEGDRGDEGISQCVIHAPHFSAITWGVGRSRRCAVLA
jgi:hypothetical protein